MPVSTRVRTVEGEGTHVGNEQFEPLCSHPPRKALVDLSKMIKDLWKSTLENGAIDPRVGKGSGGVVENVGDEVQAGDFARDGCRGEGERIDEDIDDLISAVSGEIKKGGRRREEDLRRQQSRHAQERMPYHARSYPSST